MAIIESAGKMPAAVDSTEVPYDREHVVENEDNNHERKYEYSMLNWYSGLANPDREGRGEHLRPSRRNCRGIPS